MSVLIETLQKSQISEKKIKSAYRFDLPAFQYIHILLPLSIEIEH